MLRTLLFNIIISSKLLVKCVHLSFKTLNIFLIVNSLYNKITNYKLNNENIALINSINYNNFFLLRRKV